MKLNSIKSKQVVYGDDTERSGAHYILFHIESSTEQPHIRSLLVSNG